MIISSLWHHHPVVNCAGSRWQAFACVCARSAQSLSACTVVLKACAAATGAGRCAQCGSAENARCGLVCSARGVSAAAQRAHEPAPFFPSRVCVCMERSALRAHVHRGSACTCASRSARRQMERACVCACVHGAVCMRPAHASQHWALGVWSATGVRMPWHATCTSHCEIHRLWRSQAWPSSCRAAAIRGV